MSSKKRWIAACVIVFVISISTSFCLAECPETALSVDVRMNDATFPVANYTWDDLGAMPQTKFAYSSINAYDAPAMVAAKGIALADFFHEIGMEPADLSTMVLSSSDGATVKYKAEEYFGEPRFCFPGIFYDGEEKKEVVPMLSLEKYEERTSAEVDFSKMSGGEGISFCFGQREISDKVLILYGKYINKITLELKTGTSFEIPKEPYGTGAMGSRQTGSPNTTGQAVSTSGIMQTPVSEEDIDRGLTADILTITVGYYGGPYEIKKVFTLEELYHMNYFDQGYTYIDNMPAVVLESARGVGLADLLKTAGIDVNSVESFHFYCSDVKTSWYQSINKEYLLDTLRYYYPGLPGSWDYDESAAGAEATDNAVEVETMVAMEDNWKRFAVEPDFDHLVKKSRFRLVFGQTDTTTKNAYRSARWIHTIEVMLGGKPPEAEEAETPLPMEEVGSKVRHDNTLGTAQEDSGAGVQNWRMYEMSESAVELQKPERENPLMPVIGILTVLILILGITVGLIQYYREVH